MNKNKEEPKTNKFIVKRTVMDEQTMAKTMEILQKSFEQTKSEQELTHIIKDELEKNCGGFGWNVVIGKDFGSHIFH